MNMDDASCMGIPHPPYWHSFPLATYPCFGEVCRYGGGSLSVRDTIPWLLTRVGGK